MCVGKEKEPDTHTQSANLTLIMFQAEAAAMHQGERGGADTHPRKISANSVRSLITVLLRLMIPDKHDGARICPQVHIVY